MLPRRNQLLYASSSLGGEAMAQAAALWLFYAYAPPDDSGRTRLLSLGVAGVVFTIARFVGSLDDAVIGYLSDRTRSRLGRRLPWVLIGSPLWALFAVLRFLPPEDADQALIAVYLLVVLEFFNIFSTMAGGPYESLLPEVAPTSRERVAIAGQRVYFGVGGAAVGLVASGWLKDAFGLAWMMAAMAGLALVCRALGVLGVWRYASRTQAPATLGFRESMKVTFSNRSFLLFLPTFVLFQVGLALMLGVLPYYVRAVLEVDEDAEGRWTSILTAVAIGAMLVAVPFFVRLAARTSKRQAFSLAMLGSAAAFPLLFFAGFLPGVPPLVQVLVGMAIVGAPIVGVYLFPGTITADICDDDANRTGLRREATFYGAQNFVEKTAGSAAPLLLGGLLLLGNTAEDPLGIRLVGPVAGVLVFVGFWVFRRYDLPDEVELSPAVALPGVAETV